MAHALEVANLKKNFILPLTRKRVPALGGLSFVVPEGKIVGFLGANGAGKTTTLKIILRLIFPDGGMVKIFGKPYEDLNVKEKIGFLTERPYFYDYLSGREFLNFIAHLFDKPISSQKIEGLLLDVGLDRAADRPLRRYSKGMLQRIGIAQALINDPSLLILDEPMSGLDPDGRADMIQIIRKVHQRGATVFFSSHLLSDVEALCDDVVIIDKGKLIVESSVSELLSRHSKGYILEVNEGSKLQQYEFQKDSELQKAIDQARQKNHSIVRVSAMRPTLEEVFLKMKRENS